MQGISPMHTASPTGIAWSIRGGYFWFYAAIGAFMPFAALYYRELGFDGIQIGLLTALPSLGMALLGPFLGALADARALHRVLLRGGLALAAITGLAISQASTFAPIFILVGLLAIVTVPIPPLLDSYAMTTSEASDQSYGSLRVWGSLGYMGLTLAMGWLIGDSVSSIVLIGYGASLGLALLSTIRLPPMAERRPQSIIAGLGDILRNQRLVLLLVIAFLLATCGALLNVYLGVHMEGLGASSRLMGFAFAVSAAAELPIIAGGGWILRRLGPVRLMMVAIGTYAIRFTILSLIDQPALVVASQLLHGLTFGAFLMASVTLAHQIAGRAHAATAQSLLSAMSFGLGSITGALIGGTMLDRIGTVGMYRVAAVVSLIALGIAIVGNRRINLGR
jgi:PPP family 3-phenylpropionic acid transporter